MKEHACFRNYIPTQNMQMAVVTEWKSWIVLNTLLMNHVKSVAQTCSWIKRRNLNKSCRNRLVSYLLVHSGTGNLFNTSISSWFLLRRIGLLVWAGWGRRKRLKRCQFRFDRYFVFSIEIECFSFRVFRRAVSGLYCSYIYSTRFLYLGDLIN